MKPVFSAIKNIFSFYYDGFRDMPRWGRKAWMVLLIKLFIIFVILRLFFFHDLLKENFRNDSDRSNFVRNQILNTNNK
jgi:hypothetical protein